MRWKDIQRPRVAGLTMLAADGRTCGSLRSHFVGAPAGQKPALGGMRSLDGIA
jgi:hypothetical protein